jgi:hypothetical protein
MKKYLCALLIVLSAGASATARAQDLGRVFVSAADLAIQLPRDLTEFGDHSVVIRRQFATPTEEKVIQIAEAAYGLTGRDDDQLLSRATRTMPAKDPIWARRSIDDVLIADVVSARAVKYYWDVSVGYRGNPGFIKGREFQTTKLAYSASLRREDTYVRGGARFECVYIVSLRLVWAQECGMECGMNFERAKEVVVNDGGEVLAVYFDNGANRSITVS